MKLGIEIGWRFWQSFIKVDKSSQSLINKGLGEQLRDMYVYINSYKFQRIGTVNGTVNDGTKWLWNSENEMEVQDRKNAIGCIFLSYVMFWKINYEMR